ncbi:hypothetical protein LOTGIDRAFT_180616 [Lottia gigantea]|uniref:Epidermal retinol dehydrogenase 2 n=1 Tax=Lottia gigantea TaxID=225164 RepID=V3ZYK3_LOTGI|nr:hypothetical protein LOTGIDRAFT_180616 [Lottia gigantea]ESO96613.1 hypothetical protein LOTGIDRAFT_180616 [Lottia gigantea]
MKIVVETMVVLFKVLYYWLEAIVLACLPSSVRGKDISGETALITGAGSGIGRLLAKRFADQGCRLILWDINTAGNEATAKEMRKRGVTVRTYTVDLSNREDIYKAAEKVRTEVGQVDVLVNNAGIVTGRKFLDCPDSLIQKTMEVNSVAHFWTVKAFLPTMIQRNHGHIVTLASSAGLVGVSGLADYCASKYAAVGFDESIRFELEKLGKDGVHTTVVCPFLINTGMFDGCIAKFPLLLPILDPDYAVDSIMTAILINQEIIVLPKSLYLVFALKGILPTKCSHILSNFFEVSNCMDDFKGRGEKKTQ